MISRARPPTSADRSVHLISRWNILPGKLEAAVAALEALAAAVHAREPGTLVYTVHTPELDDPRRRSLPTPSALEVVFYEVYASQADFEAHVSGPTFTRFVAEHGELFVSPPETPGKPLMLVEFLTERAGFSRAPTRPAPAGPPNRHPAVMFEILARDQGSLSAFYGALFGWRYRIGENHFAYIDFPLRTTPLLGGIGQADPSQQGFEAGTNFYLQVDDVHAAVARVVALGGSEYLAPLALDGYHLAMVCDPEGNRIGLIQPFAVHDE